MGSTFAEWTAVDNSRIIVGFLGKNRSLFLLIVNAFEESKVFQGFIVWDVLHSDCLATSGLDLQRGWWMGFRRHLGRSILLEVVVCQVALALVWG